MKTRFLFVALLLAAVMASTVWASDFEYSPRFMALADTGNAIFNPTYFAPVFENIAAACESNKFYVGGESRVIALYGIGSDSKRDYNFLNTSGGGYVKSAFPLGEDNEEDWTGRAGLIFQPGVQATFLRKRITETDSNLELTDSRLAASPTIRFGAAYGFHQIFAAGLGFTMYPTTIFYNNFKGTQDLPDGSSNEKFEDTWTITGPFMITPEVGFLFRTEDGMQFGLTYEMGYHQHNKQSIKHKTADGDLHYDTEAAVVKPNNLGLGWAYKVPDVDNFFVAVDFDVYFADSYKGKTYDVRDPDRDYFVRSNVKSKEDPDAGQGALDPNGYEDTFGNVHTIGDRYYASSPARYIFSASVEKNWEIVGLRGGMGYSAESGLDADRPTSTFYSTVGPTLFFDETIFMNAAGRLDLGFTRAETSYFVFGGGLAISLGGTF
jgi:hypothetical protein